MRDDFNIQTKDVLAKRVGYMCSNPNCRKHTIGPNEDSAKTMSIGVAAHITAASPRGPRYDSSLTSQERCSIENGIWLCQNCAKMIDSDETRFTKDMLINWKLNAELVAHQNVTGTKFVSQQPDSIKTNYLNNFVDFHLENLFGREEDLVTINNHFVSRNVIFIHGVGGIGKTTVAKAYVKKYTNQYTHIAYIENTSSIMDSLLSQLSSFWSLDNVINLTNEQKFQLLLNNLRNLPNLLLILDNCNDARDLLQSKQILEGLRQHIIITTRCKINTFVKESISL